MAHAVIESQPTETTPCPAWCLGDHLNDEYPDMEFSGTIHQRKVTVGDMSVTIQETTDAPEGCPDPVGGLRRCVGTKKPTCLGLAHSRHVRIEPCLADL